MRVRSASSASVGVNGSIVAASAGDGSGSGAAKACGAAVSSLTGASRVDRSSRLPPHRVRVSSHGPSATVTAVALAANGRSSTAADVGQHLVAAVGADRNHCAGARRGCDLRQRVAPGLGRVVGHGRVGDRPRPRRAPCGGRGGQVVAVGADHDRLDGRAAELVRQAAGQAERLEGRLRGHAPVVLDQHEHRPAHPMPALGRSGHSLAPLAHRRPLSAARAATDVRGRPDRTRGGEIGHERRRAGSGSGGHARPSSSSRSTTAGAASGPVPRMVVSVTCSTGRAKASVCRPPGSPTAVCSATSAFFERSRPGRVG